MDEHADPIPRAIEMQARSCEALGSPTYARILRGFMDDYLGGGVIHDLLHGRFERPVHDAAPLRLLGGLHAEVLRGASPLLAAHFPTAGGTPGTDLVARALEATLVHRSRIEAALERPVQTNEVGRSIVLLVLAHWLKGRGFETFDLVEIGTSAGLNLNFDRYRADAGDLVLGDPDSALRFGPDWFDEPVPVSPVPARVTSRVGIDPAPLDAVDPESALTLRSFVWPDHVDRMNRLSLALGIARRHRPLVERASADSWLDTASRRSPARCTVVFHSIVWQYLGSAVQDRVRHALTSWSDSALPEAPVVWARMEPAGDVADVRVTVASRSGREEFRLAEVGYHGRGFRWLETS